MKILITSCFEGDGLQAVRSVPENHPALQFAEKLLQF